MFSELPAYAGFYFSDEIEYDPEAAKKDLCPKTSRAWKNSARRLPPRRVRRRTLEAALKETAKALGVKAGVLVHPCRLAFTGKPAGPSLYHLLEVLGKEKVMARMGQVIEKL